MVAGCGNKCVKYTFFTFNFLFFVFGTLIMVTALWARFDNEFQNRLGNLLTDANLNHIQLDRMYIGLYAMAGIGAILFITGFLGCCGACCESLCVLGMFFSAVLLLFGLQLAASIFMFVKKDTFKEDFTDWYKSELVGNYDKFTEVKNQLDQLHKQLSCCGARGCLDFNSTTIPDSCAQYCTPNGDGQGCAYKIYDAVASNLLIVAIVSITVLAIELLAMIFSCVLCSAIKTGREYDYY